MSERPLLDGDLRRQLSRVSDLRGALDGLAVGGTIVGALFLAHALDRWWAYGLAVLLIASRQNALASLAHEGVHRLCFRDRRWNDRIAAFAYAYPIGILFRHDGRRHLQHHRDVGLRRDPDWVNYTNEGRDTPAGVVRYLLSLLVGVRLFELARSVLLDRAPRIQLEEDGSRVERAALRREFLAVLACQALLFAGMALCFAWWTYPLLWVLPLVTVASFLVNLRALIEHAAVPDEVAPETRIRDFTAGPLEAFFLSPAHFHYHALHHAFVTIPHRNLPLARWALAGAHGGHYPLEVWPGYLRSLRLHMRALGERSREAAAAPTPAEADADPRQPRPRRRVACEQCGATGGEPVTGWLRDEESAEQLPPAFRDETFRFVRCGGCGLVYLPERPDAADLDVYYGVEYKCFESFEDRGAVMRGLARLVARQKRRQIESLMPPGHRRLLDYGCGAGTWLEQLRAVGADFEMMGCDVTPVAVERVRAQGIPAWVCDETTLFDHLERGSIGAIHLFHVIEHVPDAKRCLEALHEALAPGGVVIGQTPNVASLGRRVWGDHWDQWHVPRHLVLFDHDTLRRRARDAGFEVVEIKSSLSGATQWALSALAWWASLRGRPFRTSHEPLYPPLILAFLPVTVLEALFSHTCHMDFVLRKPAAALPGAADAA